MISGKVMKMAEYRIATKELRKLGSVQPAEKTTPEEINALARVLTNAGLIVNVKDRALQILVKE